MKRQAFSVLAISMTAVLPAAAAGEVCVSCSGPPAIYRCTVDEASKVESYRYGKKILQFVCITELAKQGGHQQCKVKRTGSDGCFGLPRTVPLTGSLDATAARAEAQPAESFAEEQEPAAEPAQKQGPPKTVEELARRTASASKEQFQKTGNTVGDAVKKSWGCIASLFKDC